MKMAAGVDLKWVSQVLSVIPDPSGYSQVAALVVSILGGVDISKLANLVGQVQETAWAAVEKLLPPPGQLPDPLGAGAAMTRLLPVGVELASVAVNMLSGKATKTDPTLLGKQSSTATSITTRAQNLKPAIASPVIDHYGQLTGRQRPRFLSGGGARRSGLLRLRGTPELQHPRRRHAGRNAIQWISDWLNLQIGRAA